MFFASFHRGWRPAVRPTFVFLAAVLLGTSTSTPIASALPVSAEMPQRVVQVPSNMAATSAVALAADPSGVDDVFYRGEDGAVYQRTFHDGTWTGQVSLGGRAVGAPSASVAGSRIVVAVRGTDGFLWLRLRSQGVWGPWHNVGGVLSASPTVVGDATGRIDVVVRGSDNRLWARSLPAGGTWSSWTDLGGVASSGPAALSPSPGDLDVYVTGADGQVMRRARLGGVWSAWQALGGLTYTGPTVTRDSQSGVTSVFVRGTNNGLYLRQRTPSGWTSWQNLGGVLIDAPAALAVGGSGIDVVVRGGDNALWSRRQRGGTWSGWAKAWTPAPPPDPAPGMLGTDWTRIPTTQPVVALTFDAGANANAIPSILRTLQTKRVPATFFLTGEWTRDFPAQSNLVSVAGFPIGNHSDTHPDLRTLTDDQVRAELLVAQSSILRTTGVEPRPLFRFPLGGVDSHVLGIVNSLDYVAVRWTVDTLGWQGTSGGRSAEEVIDRVLAGLQPGEIVLMHVGSHPTDGSTLDADALPRMIDEIRARGYSFVTLEALVGP